jgi:hypothetical protein
VEKFDLSFVADGKLLEITSDWLGLYAQKNNSPPVPSYSTLLPFAGYAPTITTSAGLSSDITDMSIKYDQKCTLWYPANGTPDFITVYFGERKFEIDFTARFDNDTLYNMWRNNVSDTLTVDIKGPVISHAYNQELSMTFANISYDTMEHDTSKDNVLMKGKATAIVPAGSNLVTGFVQNTVSSYAT